MNHMTDSTPEGTMSNETNDDMVICPDCAHQFRAIPVNVQKALAARGEQKPVAWKDTCRSTDEHGVASDEPVLLGYEGWENLPDGTDLYAAPPAQPAAVAEWEQTTMKPRSCTCHPDDAVHPCAQKCAASECQKAHGERVLLMRSAEVGRWIQADGRSISGEYRYATLDPKEGEQT